MIARFFKWLFKTSDVSDDVKKMYINEGIYHHDAREHYENLKSRNYWR